MRIETIDTPAEADLRFLRYRLEVIGGWPASPRKAAAAEAISQRLTALARSVLVRPDNADLLHLSCQLLDDFFAAKLKNLKENMDPFPRSDDKARAARVLGSLVAKPSSIKA